MRNVHQDKNVNEIAKETYLKVMSDSSVVEKFESFCEELETLKVNEEIYDYGELFSNAKKLSEQK